MLRWQLKRLPEPTPRRLSRFLDSCIQAVIEQRLTRNTPTALYPGSEPRWVSAQDRPLGSGTRACDPLDVPISTLPKLVIISLAIAAAPGHIRAENVAPSTERMANRLAEIAKARVNPFDSQRAVEGLRQQLREAPAEPLARVRIMYLLVDQLLNAGEPAEALVLLAKLRELAPDVATEAPDFDYEIRDLTALAHFRRGEQANCLAHRNVDSCLLPIRGSGIHADPTGSRAAIAEYTGILALRPTDLTARWLLNIAAMTVGDYPEKVDPRWLIPPAVFASEFHLPRFVDAAAAAGIAVRGHAGGSIMEDLDRDGLLDVMSSSWGDDEPLQGFRNLGTGTFEVVSTRMGLTGISGGLNLTQSDYDNDGLPDVFVTRGGWRGQGGHIPNSLLANVGGFRFRDVTEEAGLRTKRPTQVSAWADFDGDGLIDLFVGNESAPSDPNLSELWHNRGDGTFHDVTELLGNADLGYVKGAAWGDINDDGRPDLYVSVMGAANRLFVNLPEGFVDIAASSGVQQPGASFACWFFDYDNDGKEDIFVAPFEMGDPSNTAALYLKMDRPVEVPRLYHNLGNGIFADVTAEAHLDRVTETMGSNFGDFDNDGFPDLYLGTGNPDLRTVIPNRAFRNDGRGKFLDVTTSGGFGHLQKGHAVSFGDIDGDGDQDIHEDIGGAVSGDIGYNVLFENPGNQNRWVTLRLVGRSGNRAAVGARVRAVATRGELRRSVYATVGTGGSFGASSLQVELGLGAASVLETIEIAWPAGRKQTLTGLAMDRIYEVVEGEEAKVVDGKRFKLGG